MTLRYQVHTLNVMGALEAAHALNTVTSTVARLEEENGLHTLVLEVPDSLKPDHILLLGIEIGRCLKH